MSNNEEKWIAVINKDPLFDGKFVYAVKTTGTYSRPSCPSKKPKRENVEFYASTEEAEKAGYHPCSRCNPKSDTDSQQKWINQACDYIKANSEKQLSLKTISEEIGISPFHIQRTFKKAIGLSPREYQEACRIENLKNKLRKGDTVTSIVYKVGYGSTSWLYSGNQSKLGMTPSEYREGGQGLTIRYQIVDSPMGRLLVARTDFGVCYIGLWDNDEDLVEALREEYPAAELIHDEKDLHPWTRGVLGYVIGRVTHLEDVPFDIHGTDFQIKVWKALRDIPRGSTRSYHDIAKTIGRPSASRAVGGAVRTNPIALLIPCHRVIRKNGDIGFYGWGVERKKALLKLEEAPISE